MSVEKLIVNHMETWTSALQTRSTAGRGSSGKIDLYGIKKLRELILELAVRGKLVPQDPNDEPASELLKRIAAEKAELVKQGKIKKQKPLPEISEEEKPFELPEGWEWVRLGDATYNRDAERIPLSSDERMNRKGDFDYYGASGIIDKIDDYIFDKPLLLIGEDGANLINRSTPIAFMAYGQFWVNNHAHVLDGISEDFLNYLCIYINAISLENYITGTAQPKMNQAKMNTILIGLPPEHEQLKIKNKVTELLSLCDQLEQQSLTSLDAHQQLVETLLGTLTDSQNAEELAENWARISVHFDTLFTTEASVDVLKQTILQLAVMGKLVPQDPNDEPASELLKRIAQEKAQLVKEGKIKKQKPLPPISDEEKPFELPEGWEWCLFEDIIDIQSGITKGRNLSNRTLVKVPYLRVANVQRGYLDLTEIKQIEIPIEEKEKYQVVKGDLLITEGGDWDTVGRTTVWCHDWYIANQNHVFKGRNIGQDVDPYWLETYMNSPFSRQYFANASKQTTNLASINKTQLRGCPVAIPPSSEAKKIMSKLHIFYKLCEELKNHIQSAQQTQLHLADALTDAAIN
ncbi:restriction endonuclease subunit S [Escherichia coli]|uniref:restriction endonuclease subunit S n=1 Tax=Escherichia coli TaxID=562 RepID=UPI0013662123|nr:restriction endonuclease subunit S [Escherichia coli]MWT70281.1 restriction endonuclease subunit S [Escherichia coli]